MTRKVTISNQEVYVLPKPSGGVIWWGDRRIELNHHELNELASALADAAAPQMVVAAA